LGGGKFGQVETYGGKILWQKIYPHFTTVETVGGGVNEAVVDF